MRRYRCPFGDGGRDIALATPAVQSCLRGDHPGCGMLEYLVRLFRGEFDDMWADDGVLRFVHVREAQRLLAAGIDPDTGEPNPYAGMFGPC